MLLKCAGGVGKFVGRDRVEFEHVVVAGNGNARTDILCQGGSFAAREVPRDAALRAITVDRKEGNIDLEGPEVSFHILEEFCVAGMIEGPCVGLEDIAEEAMAAPVILFDEIVCGRDGGNLEASHAHGVADIESAGLFGDEAKAIHNKFAIGFGNDYLDFWIHTQQRDKCLFIKVVGVIVA